MTRNPARLKEIKSLLSSSEPVKLTDTITALREEVPFEGVVSLLADLYDISNDIGVRRTIEDFLNDIRDNDLRPELMTEIQKNHDERTRGMLVASCWQSGLDYSQYITEIAEVFLEGSYATAIECMTLIGEMMPDCNDEMKNKAIKIVSDSLLAATKEKYPLTNELLSILHS